MRSLKLLLKVFSTSGKRLLAIFSLPLLAIFEGIAKYSGSSRKSILKFNVNAESKPSRVAVYAVYPARTKTAEVEMVIATLKKLGYYVFLVTNSDAILPINCNASAHLVRRNRGRDLAAYREAVGHLKFLAIQELLLINDSCFWYEDGLIETTKEARKLNYDVTSITVSNQRTRHLQTYFLMIKSEAVSTVIEILELKIRDWKLKRSIVTFGELNLTRWLENYGLKCGALLSESSAVQILEKSRKPTPDESEAMYLIGKRFHVNPSQYFWRILWDDFGFVKKTLIYENPLKLLSAPSSIEALPERNKTEISF